MVSSLRSRSATGHPTRHDTPVMRLACAASIRSTVARKLDPPSDTLSLGGTATPADAMTSAAAQPAASAVVAADAARLTSRGGQT